MIEKNKFSNYDELEEFVLTKYTSANLASNARTKSTRTNPSRWTLTETAANTQKKILELMK